MIWGWPFPLKKGHVFFILYLLGNSRFCPYSGHCDSFRISGFCQVPPKNVNVLFNLGTVCLKLGGWEIKFQLGARWLVASCFGSALCMAGVQESAEAALSSFVLSRNNNHAPASPLLPPQRHHLPAGSVLWLLRAGTGVFQRSSASPAHTMR